MRPFYGLSTFLVRMLARIFFRIRISGRENIPKAGAFILAANHISYYDPPLLGSFVGREIHFLAKKELFRNRLFGALITYYNSHPLNRHGMDRQAIETVYRVLESGEAIIIFPEGTRAKGRDFLPPKPGIGMIAQKVGVPIIPAYIHGSNRLKGCFLDREKMGIIYGQAIDPGDLAGFGADKGGYQGIAELIMERIGGLKAEFLKKQE